MNFNLSGPYDPYGPNQPTPQSALGMMNANVPPRTLREQIGDRVAWHEGQIVNLKAALEALSPDVEKALNALQKL